MSKNIKNNSKASNNNSAGVVTINGSSTTTISSNTYWSSGAYVSSGTTGVWGATGSPGIMGLSGSFIGYSQVISKRKYHILGEDVEIDDFLISTEVSTNLALINRLGYEFYYDLEKTNYIFPPAFKEAIERRIVVLKREKNIDTITKD